MPFANYEDFKACERANSDKRDPGAYCAAIKRATEQGLSHDEIEVQALSDVSGDLTGLAKQESPCWDGYVMVGTKTVDGRDVPNCVPEEDAEPMEEQASNEATQQAVATSVLERQLDYLAQSDHTPWIRESSEQGIAWVDPTAGAVVYEQDSYTDYPEAAKDNAQQALDWREEHGRDEVTAGTRTGWIRANQLADGEAISRETVGRMAAFRRHEDNAEIDAEHEGTPWKDDGYVAWLLWGGDEGVSWAERIVDQEDTSEEQAADLTQLTFDDKQQAEAVADIIGCEGSHEHPDGHMPCNSHAELQSIVGDDGEIGGEQQAIVVEGLSQEGREYIESTYAATTTTYQQEIPDEAVNIQDRSEAPEDAEIITGERGGLYYVPGGENGGEGEAELNLSGMDTNQKEAVESGVEMYLESFGDLPPDTEITTDVESDPMTPDVSTAQAVMADNRVEINSDIDLEMLDDYFNRGLLVGNGLDYITAHELSHLRTPDAPLDFESEEHSEILEEQVSVRASQTPGEALAEIGAMKATGEEISDDLREIWETYTEAEL